MRKYTHLKEQVEREHIPEKKKAHYGKNHIKEDYYSN